MKILSLLLFIVSSLLFTFEAYAHGGRLNSQGCHNNRKTGGYHCHRSQRAAPPPVIQQKEPEKDSEDDKEKEDDDGGGHSFFF